MRRALSLCGPCLWLCRLLEPHLVPIQPGQAEMGVSADSKTQQSRSPGLTLGGGGTSLGGGIHTQELHLPLRPRLTAARSWDSRDVNRTGQMAWGTWGLPSTLLRMLDRDGYGRAGQVVQEAQAGETGEAGGRRARSSR